MIIELKRIADAQWDWLPAWLQRRLGQLASGTDNIHNDGITLPKVRQVPGHHGRRSTDQGGIVQAHHVAGLEGAIRQPCLDQALIQWHGPLHPFHTADAVEFRILQWLDVIDELHLGVHDPQVGEPGVGDKSVGTRHQADKDGPLLGDEQRSEGEPDDNAQVLGAVAHQHLQSYSVHPSPPYGCWANCLSAASEKCVMWSTNCSSVSGVKVCPGSSRVMTGRAW